MSQKWNEETTAKLVKMIGNEKPVTNATVDKIAENLGYTGNSVASKLRKLGYEVASRAKTVTKTFTDKEAEELKAFVTKNNGKLTYAEIAASFANGKFSTKQIQGKLLSMELTGPEHVKPTEKVETPKTYTDAEEATLLQMVNAGAFVEDIAQKLGKTIPSIRGKVLSLLKQHPDLKMPKQRQSYAQKVSDGLESLGDVSELTVEEIAEKLDKSPRGVKVMLTNRGISCANYKGAEKRVKLDSKKEQAA